MILKIKEAREGAPCVMRRALRVVVRAPASDREEIDRDRAVHDETARCHRVHERVRAAGVEVLVDERVGGFGLGRRVVAEHDHLEHVVKRHELLVVEVMEDLPFLRQRGRSLHRQLEHVVDLPGERAVARHTLGGGFGGDGLDDLVLRDPEAGLGSLLRDLILHQRGCRRHAEYSLLELSSAYGKH
jgi:hypothetical protein